MKRTITVIGLLAIVALAGATAQGFGPGQGMRPGQQGGMFQGGNVQSGMPWGGPGAGFAGEAEEVERSGRLVLAAGELPALTVGAISYTLRIHPALADEVELQNGQQISVEGYEVEFRNADLLTTTRIIHVSALEAGGTRVVVPADGYGRMGGPGMMGGPGSRGAWGSTDDFQGPARRR